MTKVNPPKHIFTAQTAEIPFQPMKGRTREHLSWRKILAGVCPKEHKIEGIAIKQTIVGWCKYCRQEIEIK